MEEHSMSKELKELREINANLRDLKRYALIIIHELKEAKKHD